MQGSVVLVLLSIGRIWVQAVSELRVALIQLPGQGFIAAHQGLAEFGGGVAHGFKLTKGCLNGPVADSRLPDCLPTPPSSSSSVHQRSQLRVTWFSVFPPCK